MNDARKNRIAFEGTLRSSIFTSVAVLIVFIILSNIGTVIFVVKTSRIVQENSEMRDFYIEQYIYVSELMEHFVKFNMFLSFGNFFKINGQLAEQYMSQPRSA